MFFNKPRNYLFSVNDMVRVKSKETILQSVGKDGTLDGCLFAQQMWDYCGNVYTISKIVYSLFNERQKRTYRPKAPLYILDYLTCVGQVENITHVCDRTCFLLWHEGWLEKVK